MDYAEYRKKFFTDPAPQQRFRLQGIMGVTLYYEDYRAALKFVAGIFGEPAYQEGDSTHGWRLGRTWLTLFPAEEGSPRNLEVPVHLQSVSELDRLYAAFIAAGATGRAPENTLMYQPVRLALVVDPFGVTWQLVAEI
ncbi:MAG: hypothetical protein KIS85_01125 [Anaerolineales bacterium]|nr:hypothetical protein [Anaerolineales bacterium]